MGKYHDILGIEPGASDDQVKKAYRRMAKKYHPDTNAGDKDAEAKFKEISEAYEGLKKGRTGPDINAEADNYAKNNWGFDLGAIFKEMARQTRTYNSAQEGMFDGQLNIKMNMEIPLKTFLRGGKVDIAYNVQNFDRPGTFYYDHFTKTIELKPGTKVGTTLEFPGEGPKNTKGEKGILFLHLFAGSDAPFEVHNHLDIIVNVMVDPFNIMLGMDEKILHPDDKTMIDFNLPPGGSPNQVVIVEGMGLQSLTGDCGDLLIQVRVQYPVLNVAQRKTLSDALEVIKKQDVEENDSNDDDDIQFEQG